MRKGTYASYRGKEFRFMELDDHTIKLISDDIEDKKFGFTPSLKNENVFTKIVDVKNTDHLVFITPYAVYKNMEFQASNSSQGMILLDTEDIDVAKELEFEQTDKYIYSKLVPKDTVQIIEKKKPYSL